MKKIIVIIICLLAAITLNAQTALEDTWITNGGVSHTTRGDGKIFLGGSFDWVGPAYGGGVAVFNTTLTYDDSFPLVGQDLRTAVSDDAGGWYIARDNTITHLKADKTLTELPITVSGVIYTLAKMGNLLYIGGSITVVNGIARTGIVSFDLSAGSLTSWNPNSNGTIQVIKCVGSVVYAGGNFTTIGGQTRLRIAALDASTALATAWNANVAAGSSNVYAISADASIVCFGGNFSNAGSGIPARTNFAAVNTTTGALVAFNPRPNSFVYDLLLDGNTLYMAGNFSQIVGVANDGFAVLDVTTGLFTAFAATFNNEVKSFAIDGQKLFIGGVFTTVNGEEQPRFAALDKTTGALETMDEGKISDVPDILVVSGGNILALSEDYFQGVTGVACSKSCIALDEDTGQPTDWIPEMPSLLDDEYIFSVSLHYQNNRVYYLQRKYHLIGSYYESVLGVVNSTDGAAINTWAVTVDDEVEAWAFSDDALYLAGQFTNVNGVPRDGFAAVDLITGALLPWTISQSMGFNNGITSMAVHNNVLYVAGEFFFTDNGIDRSNLAAWDATTGSVSDWAPTDFTDFGWVRLGEINDTFVYVLGDGALRVDVITGEIDPDWLPELDEDDQISSMVIHDSYIYLGGSFAPNSLAGVVRIDITTGEIAGAQPDLDDNYSSEGSGVSTLAISETKLFVGGGFYYDLNGLPRSCYAEYILPEPTDNVPPVILATSTAVSIEGVVTIDLVPLITDVDDNQDLSTLQLLSEFSEQGASVSIDDAYQLILDYGGVEFFGTDRISIEVCDFLFECAQQELTIEVGGDVLIYNALSPDNNGSNDIFKLGYIDILPDANKNRVTIYNRWGDVVWEGSDYDNSSVVFDGTNNNGKDLPSGTYFYKIDFSSGKQSKTGYLSLKR